LIGCIPPLAEIFLVTPRPYLDRVYKNNCREFIKNLTLDEEDPVKLRIIRHALIAVSDDDLKQIPKSFANPYVYASKPRSIGFYW
jgi:hypothetical protein